MIDIIFLILLLLALFKGMRVGFVLAIFSFLASIIGLAAALKLSAILASRLHKSTNIGERWLPFLSFIIILIAVSIIVKLVARLIQKAINIAMLGLINKLAGFLLYAILYTIIYSVILFYASQMNLIKPATIAASKTYDFIEPWGPKIMDALGSVIPLFKDLFIQLENFFNSAAQKAGS